MTDEEILARVKTLIEEHKDKERSWGCKAHRDGESCCIDFLMGIGTKSTGLERTELGTLRVLWAPAEWKDRPTNPDN